MLFNFLNPKAGLIGLLLLLFWIFMFVILMQIKEYVNCNDFFLNLKQFGFPKLIN